MTQIMFETFHVPATYIANSSVLSLVSSGRSTGLVIEIGEDVGHCVPIYESHVISHAILGQDFAGRYLTDFMVKMKTERGYSPVSKEMAREIKNNFVMLHLTFRGHGNFSILFIFRQII